MKVSSAIFACDDCGWTGYPGFDLSGAALYAQCGSCAHIDRRYTPADFNTAIARIDGRDVVVDDVGTTAMPFVTMPAAPIVAQAMPRATAVVPAGKSLPVLRMARARVRELNALLKQAKAWQAERDELVRLLSAAKRRRAIRADEPVTITTIAGRIPKSASR